MPFGSPAHCARQDRPLNVPPYPGKLALGRPMVDPLDILLDDRTFIQLAGHEMSGRADKLDASLTGMEMRSCTFETRQEAVVDIYASARKLPDELRRQDLHVSGEHRSIGFALSK